MYGSVYEATFEDELVAVKICKRSFLRLPAAAMEFKCLSLCDPRFVVPAYASTVNASGDVVVVMKRMKCDLRRYLGLTEQSHLRTMETRVSLCNRLVDLLEYLQRSRVVHNDLKATNILVSDKGELFLSDFGLFPLRFSLTPGA